MCGGCGGRGKETDFPRERNSARPLLAPTETTQTFHWANVWFRRSDFTSGIVPPLRIRNHYRRESGRRIVEKDDRGGRRIGIRNGEGQTFGDNLFRVHTQTGSASHEYQAVRYSFLLLTSIILRFYASTYVYLIFFFRYSLSILVPLTRSFSQFSNNSNVYERCWYVVDTIDSRKDENKIDNKLGKFALKRFFAQFTFTLCIFVYIFYDHIYIFYDDYDKPRVNVILRVNDSIFRFDKFLHDLLCLERIKIIKIIILFYFINIRSHC